MHSKQAMDFTQLSFESLKAYPRWLVMTCVGILLMFVFMLIAKPLKWGLYLILALMFVGILVGLYAWLGWSG